MPDGPLSQDSAHRPGRTARRRAGLALAAALAWICLAGGPALAQSTAAPAWPSKPVTIVVPYSAGGGTDIVARNMAQKLTELWGVSVNVDNRPGANGVTGSASVAKSAPDGYTLLMVVGSHAINPVLMKQLPYDTVKAFTPITRLADSPMVVVAQAKGPIKSLRELVEMGRKDELAMGYSEGQTRLTVELIKHAAQIKALGVPYKGGAPIMLDVIGGHLPLGVTSVLTAMPHVQSGALRVVAVAAADRLPVFPDAQTLREGGVMNADSLNWYGLFGPAGLPAAQVDRIFQDLKKVTSDPVVAKHMAGQGAQIAMVPPDAFAQFLQRETTKWGEVARRSGIQPE